MCFKTKVSLLLLALFIGAGVFSMSVQPAEAASLAELQQIIEQLKTQIAELQERLAAVQQGKEDPIEWCHDFNKNLKYGDKGAEVEALQMALVKEGFYNDYSSQQDPSKAYFDERLASAVVGFQEKYAKEILAQYGLTHGTGFVGKSTRAKLNQLYGCEIEIPEKCTDTDGGINYYVKGTVRLNSESKTDDCFALKTYPIVYKVVEYYCSGNEIKSKTFTCENGCKDGACIKESEELTCVEKCQAKGYDSGVCRMSCETEEVNLGYLSSCNPPCPPGMACPAVEYHCCCQKEGQYENLPPVIDGLTAPTQLKVNEKGVWTIKAQDPENGVLSYSVNWGDEYAKTTSPDSASAQLDTGIQITTFTHSYAQAGTYTIRFIVTDDNQQTAKTSTTIKIGGSEIICTDSDGGIRKYVRGRTCKDLYNLKQDSNSSDPTSSSFGRFCRTDKCVYLPDQVPILEENKEYSITKNYVEEYYCSNNKIFSKRLYCENGCENGACKRDETTCTDTDGGKDYYTKGTTIDQYVGSGTDYCVEHSENTPQQKWELIEYWCEDSGDGRGLVQHSGGYYCSDGCADGACAKSQDKDLVGYWRFDENSGNNFFDASMYGNNGTINGQTWVLGKYNSALQFTGVRGYGKVANHSSLNFNSANQFTIDFWMKRDGSLIQRSEALISKGTNSYNKGYNVNLKTDNTLYFGVRDGKKTYSCISNSKIDDKNWHHIVAVWDGNILYLYIDEELDNLEYLGDVVIADDYKILEFGNHWGYTDNNHPFHGIIDEVKIYRKVAVNTECAVGDKVYYTCPDNTKVPSCECGDDGIWACVNSPESQCPVAQDTTQ